MGPQFCATLVASFLTAIKVLAQEHQWRLILKPLHLWRAILKIVYQQSVLQVNNFIQLASLSQRMSPNSIVYIVLWDRNFLKCLSVIPEDEDYKISLPLCSLVSISEKHESSASFTPNTPSSSAISSESSITSSQSKTPKKSTYYRGRVGFRCVHCVHAQPRPSFICTNGDKKSRVLDPEVIIQNSNAPMATFYPKSLADLYRLVCTWQRVHFHKCRHIPPSVRNLYHKLKHTDRTRGKTKYWVTSAKEIGLADDPRVGGCVRYYPEAKDQ